MHSFDYYTISNIQCTILSVHIQTRVTMNSKIIQDYTGYDQNEAIMATLMGFSYEKMYGHFYFDKKSGHNNEVTIRRVRPYTIFIVPQ